VGYWLLSDEPVFPAFSLSEFTLVPLLSVPLEPVEPAPIAPLLSPPIELLPELLSMLLFLAWWLFRLVFVVEVFDWSLEGLLAVEDWSALVAPPPVPAVELELPPAAPAELPLPSAALTPTAMAASPTNSRYLSFLCIAFPSLGSAPLHAAAATPEVRAPRGRLALRGSTKAAHADAAHNAGPGVATRSGGLPAAVRSPARPPAGVGLAARHPHGG
jgi:hypothetical protein